MFGAKWPRQKVERVGDGDEGFGIDIPVPHAFVKSVLTENTTGVPCVRCLVDSFIRKELLRGACPRRAQ